MTQSNQSLADRLEAIVDEFADLDARERLELLLDFSGNLPPLPDHYEAQRLAGANRVNECQTQVHLWVEFNDGVLQFFAWVAPEAPTVQGFVAMLVEVFTGAQPADVLDVDPNLLGRLGLDEALGMVRKRGMNGILNRIRKAVEQTTRQ